MPAFLLCDILSRVKFSFNLIVGHMNHALVYVLVTAIISFVVGIVAGPLFLPNETNNSIETETLAGARPEYYTCPMHPHIHEQHEGNCPICSMALVSKTVNPSASVTSDDANRPEVIVPSSVVNNFGIKKAKVIRGAISRNVRIYGYVNQIKKSDSQQLLAPVSGVVKRINYSLNGDKVANSDLILAIESNEMLQLQKDYLSALNANDVRTIRSIKHEFRQLGFTIDEQKQLAKARAPSGIYLLRAPYTGLLADFNIKLNQEVQAGDLLGSVTPLYSISTYAKVFETQWIWLKAGQPVSMFIRSFPGAIWKGEVRSVEDLAQSSTTAVKLFADFEENVTVNLRLGMQTEMIVATESKQDVLQVPSTSVIRTGSKNVVVVAKGDGRFQPVDVAVGLDNEEYTEIISGLSEGMEVVVSGQFLLDSESDLTAEFSRMKPPLQGHEH